ncbi:MAG TPA: LPXTG cell wall anchor domain-containing protein [Candidatus Saccharimonadales bacterium]|nr:LPXTG cell wall anchor domain-containing protein [Candidatus Saccharimonadales bacterium]
MRRTGQGGSLLGFIIAAVVLTALLAGGVYLVHLQSSSASQPSEKPQDQPVSSPPSSDGDEKKPDTPTPRQSTPTPTPTQLPSANPESHQLPQTGPEQTFATLVGLTILSGVLVSYVRSRRTLASL